MESERTNNIVDNGVTLEIKSQEVREEKLPLMVTTYCISMSSTY